MRPQNLPAASVAALLAWSLTGCSGGTAAAPPPGTRTAAGTTVPPTSTSAPTPTAAPAPAVCATPVDPVPTNGPVAGHFGAAQVTAGYAFATGLLTRTTFTAAPLADPQPPQTAFAAAEEGLTPATRASFRELTARLASTTENLTPQDNTDLIGLASYGVTLAHPGLTLRSPAFRDVTCGRATTDVFRRQGQPDALVLRFPVSGTFLLTDAAGTPQQVVFTKKMELSLAPTGEPARPWLLDGWRAELAKDGPKPDTTS